MVGLAPYALAEEQGSLHDEPTAANEHQDVYPNCTIDVCRSGQPGIHERLWLMGFLSLVHLTCIRTVGPRVIRRCLAPIVECSARKQHRKRLCHCTFQDKQLFPGTLHCLLGLNPLCPSDLDVVEAGSQCLRVLRINGTHLATACRSIEFVLHGGHGTHEQRPQLPAHLRIHLWPLRCQHPARAVDLRSQTLQPTARPLDLVLFTTCKNMELIASSPNR
mmetsp:Transcript_21084/g.56176  ORF Transcript_21084/g.56176 Transcript_21084/m.56176 type:complete len:219 (-) Transcript_21084:673-1329(-)